MKDLKKEKDERFSLRCTQMYTLSLANKLAGKILLIFENMYIFYRLILKFQVLWSSKALKMFLPGGSFWQCYNLDFRGRVYPVAPHFSQMLGDPARGES